MLGRLSMGRTCDLTGRSALIAEMLNFSPKLPEAWAEELLKRPRLGAPKILLSEHQSRGDRLMVMRKAKALRPTSGRRKPKGLCLGKEVRVSPGRPERV